MIYITSLDFDTDEVISHVVVTGVTKWSLRDRDIQSLSDIEDMAQVWTACESDSGENLVGRDDDFSVTEPVADRKCETCFA